MREITDEEIAKLAEAAHAAGDEAMWKLCEIALGDPVVRPDAERADARRKCAEAIDAAEAMVTDQQIRGAQVAALNMALTCSIALGDVRTAPMEEIGRARRLVADMVRTSRRLEG